MAKRLTGLAPGREHAERETVCEFLGLAIAVDCDEGEPVDLNRATDLSLLVYL